jgi:hypothetical protein
MVSASLSNTLSNPEQLATYLARPAGSTVEGLDTSDGDAVAALLATLDWTDVTEDADSFGVRLGAARYYQATLPAGTVGKEGIKLVSELTDEELANVRLVRGKHNPELQLAGIPFVDTQVVHVIVADISSWPPAAEPTVETAHVVTWYPGRLTANVAWDTATVKLAR